ncbi:MAG: UV DNA damage repair endonuclease UvsE, partial [Oligoflexia bacterium]|nr:UV DNA damage repair endonuclease UvsE [Oligoflexia bacterium]
YHVRLSFHPDQFVVINSPKKEVVENSIQDLEYHNTVAKLLNADVINIHAGGAYGDKKSALQRFKTNFNYLSSELRSRLTLENDDKIFVPSDLLPISHELKVPLVYDIHHHRCVLSGTKWDMNIDETSKLCYRTWNREPMFHLSSPLNGWSGRNKRSHHNYINVEDFPEQWKNLTPLTIDIEAKAKEDAIKKLLTEID